MSSSTFGKIAKTVIFTMFLVTAQGVCKGQEGNRVQDPSVPKSSETETNSSSVQRNANLPQRKPRAQAKVVTPSQETPDKNRSGTRDQHRQDSTQIQGPMVRESNKTGANSSSVERGTNIPQWKPGDPVKVVSPSQKGTAKKGSTTPDQTRCKKEQPPKEPQPKK